jgi:hypothetical protein
MSPKAPRGKTTGSAPDPSKTVWKASVASRPLIKKGIEQIKKQFSCDRRHLFPSGQWTLQSKLIENSERVSEPH